MKNKPFLVLASILIILFCSLTAAYGSKQKANSSHIDFKKWRLSKINLENKVDILNKDLKKIKEELKNRKNHEGSIVTDNDNTKESKSSTENKKMSLEGFAAILLGCVSILVTVLGVMIAILALWGFSNIKKTAITASLESSQKNLNEAIKAGAFEAAIKVAVDNFIYRGISIEDIPNNESGIIVSRSNEWNKISDEQQKIILSHQEMFPIKVGAIAKDLGIVVKRSTLNPGISGEIKEDKDLIIIKINRHDTVERQRFTLAHEIAHFLLHRDKLKNGIKDNMLFRSSLSDELEVEANKLAADIVLPIELIKKEDFSPGTKFEQKVERIANLANISIPAVEIRLQNM